MGQSDEDARDKIVSWIADELLRELATLDENRFLYQQFLDAVRGNSRLLEQGGWFLHWISTNYALTATMSVRRLSDPDPRTRSLVNLLAAVRADLSLTSREKYVSLYHIRMQDTGQADYDRLVGPGEQLLPAAKVESDLHRMQKVKARIKRFTDKKLAHLDPGHLTVPLITYGDLEFCIDELVDVFKFYDSLFRGQPLSEDDLFVEPGQDWRVVFRTPWTKATSDEEST